MKAILYVKDRMGLNQLGRIEAPNGTTTLYSAPEQPEEDFPVMVAHYGAPMSSLEVPFHHTHVDPVSGEAVFVYDATKNNHPV